MDRRQALAASSAFPYVVDDAAWARRHGYASDIERRLEELKKAHPNQRYVVSLSPRRQKTYRRALYGEDPASPGNMTVTVPTGGVVAASGVGCIAEAQREVYGDLAGWFRASTVTNNLARTRAGLVTADPQFRAVLRRWSRCMHTRGHPKLSELRQVEIAECHGLTDKEHVGT